MITSPVIEVEIIKYLEPLTVYAHGIKLQVKYKEIIFTCNYSYPPFLYTGQEPELEKLVSSHEKIYNDLFTPGKILTVEPQICDTSAAHSLEKINGVVQKNIREVGYLDWEIYAEVKSAVFEETVIVDCGFPLLAFCNTAVEIGSYVKVIGEIQLEPVGK